MNIKWICWVKHNKFMNKVYQDVRKVKDLDDILNTNTEVYNLDVYCMYINSDVLYIMYRPILGGEEYV